MEQEQPIEKKRRIQDNPQWEEHEKVIYESYCDINCINNKIEQKVRLTSYGHWRYAFLKNKECEVSDQCFIYCHSQPCSYCGSINPKKTSIDRIDSKRGYYLDNIVPCCMICNPTKKGKSPDEFITFCKAVVIGVKKSMNPAHCRRVVDWTTTYPDKWKQDSAWLQHEAKNDFRCLIHEIQIDDEIRDPIDAVPAILLDIIPTPAIILKNSPILDVHECSLACYHYDE